MIKLTAITLGAYVVFLSTLLWVFSSYQAALSCLCGGILMLVNLLGLYFVWSRIFAKKSIALAVFAILIKYVVLGYLFLALSKSDWLNPVGFILGLSTLLLAILSMTVVKSFVRKAP